MSTDDERFPHDGNRGRFEPAAPAATTLDAASESSLRSPRIARLEHQRPATHTHLALRSRALALVALVLVGALLGVARPLQAAVGDCTPGQNWGVLNASFATEVVTLVNQHRASMSLGPLSVSPTLTNSANWKSLHMSYYGYMDHNDPAPPVARTPADRLAACGYPLGSVSWGENIAYGYSTPSNVMTAWLNSPGHRANIERASFQAIGVGVARAANGTMYWTQNFGSLVDSASSPPPPPSPPAPSPPTPAPSLPAPLPPAPSPVPSPPTESPAPGASTPSPPPQPASQPAPTVSSASPVAPPALTRPNVTFTRVPHHRTVKLRFAWRTTGSPDMVTCSLDRAVPTPCSSPLILPKLKKGTHTFVVRAANPAGRASVKHTWRR